MKHRTLLCGLFAFALAARAAHAQDVEDPLALHVAALLPALEARAAGAVARIDGAGRQLLAMRSYLRAGTGLAGRWSWSDAEIAAWQGSPARAELDAAIARVRGTFESANPGYSLHVNPEVRSLEIQLERWNTNPSVAAAAAALAAPGLSAHGQMGAVDFVVMQDGRIFAETEIEDIPDLWIGKGWADRLKAAVAASGAPFQGPLHNPDEPWHFDYRP